MTRDAGSFRIDYKPDRYKGRSPYWRVTTNGCDAAKRLGSLLGGEIMSFGKTCEIAVEEQGIAVTRIGASDVPLSFCLARDQSLGFFSLCVDSAALKNALERDFRDVSALGHGDSESFNLRIVEVAFTTTMGRPVVFLRPALAPVSG